MSAHRLVDKAHERPAAPDECRPRAVAVVSRRRSLAHQIALRPMTLMWPDGAALLALCDREKSRGGAWRAPANTSTAVTYAGSARPTSTLWASAPRRCLSVAASSRTSYAVGGFQRRSGRPCRWTAGGGSAGPTWRALIAGKIDARLSGGAGPDDLVS